MKKYIIRKNNNIYQIMLRVATYQGGNLAIQMLVELDGRVEPWNTLTINLHGLREHNCAFIDIDNNGEDILTWIVRHSFAVPTGRKRCSGHCEYPEYRFKEKSLLEMDKKGYEEYCECVKKSL